MAKNTAPDPASEPLRFEDALERLEEIVHSLEEGDIGLNESLERYEEGIKLFGNPTNCCNTPSGGSRF